MGHVDHVRPVWGEGLSCKGFFSVPGPLQTVQRGELLDVILALQSSDVVHLGVDNLNVVSCWVVVVALLLLSWPMMVVFFYSLIGDETRRGAYLSASDIAFSDEINNISCYKH